MHTEFYYGSLEHRVSSLPCQSNALDMRQTRAAPLVQAVRKPVGDIETFKVSTMQETCPIHQHRRKGETTKKLSYHNTSRSKPHQRTKASH